MKPSPSQAQSQEKLAEVPLSKNAAKGEFLTRLTEAGHKVTKNWVKVLFLRKLSQADFLSKIYFFSIYGKCPEEANLHRLRVDEWLLRAGGQRGQRTD